MLVALEQRGGRAGDRLAQEGFDAALLGPDVSELGHVGQPVDLGEGQGGAVHPSGRGAADDVHPGRAAGELQELLVDGHAPGPRLDELVELEDHTSHPDGQGDPAVEDDGEPHLLGWHGAQVVPEQAGPLLVHRLSAHGHSSRERNVHPWFTRSDIADKEEEHDPHGQIRRGLRDFSGACVLAPRGWGRN